MQQNKIFKSDTFESNKFKKRINRFKSPQFVEEEYVGIDFNNNLKSNHIPTLQFTNYVKSNNCKKYLTLLGICQKINNNEKEWDKLFQADEIRIDDDIPKINRLYNIISNVNEKKINRNELILKFKYLDDEEIQFYIKNINGILTLYLIDVYHIGIEAVNKKTGRIDRVGIYNARKNCNYDISEINNYLK